MTNDQTLALQFLDNFADKGWRHACLEGYAGVGKTWLIGHWLDALLKRCPGLRVLVAAPTNKALDVLRGKCGHLRVDFRTLDGYLGYRVKRNEDGDMERHKSGKPLSYDIVVVDEASMVKLSYHRELLAQRVPVLYVGDPAQLQPVGEELSPAFDTEHKCTMTEVVRQAADNPIIQLATYLRQRFGSETSPEARSFAVGVETALRRRCRELREQAEAEAKGVSNGRALVLASLYEQERKANDQWIADNVGSLKTQPDRTKGVHSAAYAAGKQHGNTISLAPQVGASKSSVKRIK